MQTPETKLLQMLQTKRPHNSSTESEFVRQYIIGPYENRCELVGPMHNIVIFIGDNPTTLFSCHTDTVHHKEGTQIISYDANFGHVYKNDGECLGADDTTGVWLMLGMIEQNIPGAYVFHRGEERGGIGSRWISENKKEWLRRFKRAVAFDRKGEDSVITQQRGRTCCSDEFAKALAAQLGDEWKPDPTGTFTDTANYTEFIPECTNLSIGYYDQHTPKEMQNLEFALQLSEIVTTVDWENLPTVRKAEPYKFTPTMHHGGFYRGANMWPGDDDDEDFRFGGMGRHSTMYSENTTHGNTPANGGAQTPYQGSLLEKAVDEVARSKAAARQQDRALWANAFVNRWSNDELDDADYIDLVNLCKADPYFAAIRMQELIKLLNTRGDAIDTLTEIVADLELALEESEAKEENTRLELLNSRRATFSAPQNKRRSGANAGNNQSFARTGK